jgi:hypothetical protein
MADASISIFTLIPQPLCSTPFFWAGRRTTWVERPLNYSDDGHVVPLATISPLYQPFHRRPLAEPLTVIHAFIPSTAARAKPLGLQFLTHVSAMAGVHFTNPVSIYGGTVFRPLRRSTWRLLRQAATASRSNTGRACCRTTARVMLPQTLASGWRNTPSSRCDPVSKACSMRSCNHRPRAASSLASKDNVSEVMFVKKSRIMNE